MHDKHIMKIDFALIVVSIIGLLVIVGYARPLVIAPIDDLQTTNTKVLFEIEKAEKILIDDNPEFSSPEEFAVEEGLEISLKSGDYYWKAEGVLGSEVRTLTINSKVDLRLKKLEDDKYGIFNAGNVNLNVDVYNGTELVDNLNLAVDSEIEAEGDKFVGGYDG